MTKFQLILLATGITCVIIILFILKENHPDNTPSSQAEWKTIVIEGGKLNGTSKIKIEDYGYSFYIRNWDPIPNTWFEAFVAAKGMHTLTYDQYILRVSPNFLNFTGLSDEKLFEKMTTVNNSVSLPNYSIYRIIYLQINGDSYVFINSQNNKNKMQADAKKKLKNNSQTSYHGSWIQLKKSDGKFVLISPNELLKNNIHLFPYFDNKIIDKIIIKKKMIWDNIENKYVPDSIAM